MSGGDVVPVVDEGATVLVRLLPHDQSLFVVRNPDQDPTEILCQARKIGSERIVGEVADGLESWADTTGQPLEVTG